MSLVSSHQMLDMDGQKAGSPRFERKKGVFIERWVILLVLFLVACAIVAVGLLVGYLGPCSLTREAQSGHPAVTTGSPGPSTEPSGEEKLDVRLPRSVYPEHYWVELRPHIVPGDFTFDGSVKILFNCREDVRNVTIHYLNMTIHRETVHLTADDDQSSNLEIGSTDSDEKRQFFIVRLKDGTLKANQSYLLSMNFTGILNDLLFGFYRSSYEENGQVKWLALTQFEPTDARRAFPCFDEPAMKATFDITLVIWNNMTAISNMPAVKTENRENDWKTVTFGTTPRMSTYLLAFVVSQFANRTNSTADGRTFSVWSVPAAINSTEYALDIGPRILNHYDDFFETPYPLNKTDMAAVPDFSAGAMENWGLITFRETVMLYDKLTSSSSNKQSICKTVAHELGHQWFGDLVTPTWWDDLWLNEGFASYMEYLGCSFVEPTWGMDQQMVLDNVHTAMELDVLKSSHPIYVPVNNPAEINEIFDTISYDKGASVIRMMEKFLGNRTFNQGLKTYLQANKYKNAASKDLWDALASTYEQINNNTKLDVAEVMNLWTTQTGFPTVTLTRDYNKKSATVGQKKFRLDKNSSSTDNTLWHIPLTWADSSTTPDKWETETKMWLKTANGNIENLTDSNNWVIVNVQEVGYYKVNYDMQNWQLLVDQLKKEHSKIHVINRAQIIDDIFDLARSYEVQYELALNTTLYLSNETEFTPWSAAMSEFAYLNVMLRRSDIYGKWKSYYIKLMLPNYQRLGWNEDLTKDDILTQYLRISAISLMCGYNYPPCVETAMTMFKKWQDNPTDQTIIPPNFRGVVYCTAIQNSDNSSTWEFMWQRYLKEQSSGEKSKLMSALSCTRELWLLSRYLRLAINESGIRKQDSVTVFSQVAKNNYGRDIAFDMMRNNWDALFESFGESSFSFGDLVKGITSSMNTPFEVQQLKEFYKEVSDQLGTAKRAFQQAIETVEDNVKFMNDHYKTIADWLNAQG